MPLPAGWSEVNVVGNYLDGEGNPARGSVTFRSATTVVVEGVIVVPLRIVAVLDGAGQLDVALPATDDPQVNPVGWRYHVTEHIYGAGRPSFWLDVPHDGGTIDLVAHTPLHVTDGVPTVMGAFVDHAHPTGEVTGLQDELDLRLRVRHIGPDVPVTAGWDVNDFWFDTSTET